MPSVMEYNKAPISVNEGKAFFNGVEVMDSMALKITFTPKTWTGQFLGDRTPSTRWLGYSIKVEVTRGRSNTFLKDAIAEYRKTGKTPEITISGICSDPGSDYIAEGNGPISVTAMGCVPTSDISLLELNTDGDILKDTITFNAKDVDIA